MSEATDGKNMDLAIAVFLWRNTVILTRKKMIAVIVWAHTVGQGRRDRMAVGNAIP